MLPRSPDPLQAPAPEDDLDPDRLDAFLARWSSTTGGDWANYLLFLTELCALLDLPPPDPAREDTQDNAYCLERRVIFKHGDGTQSQGCINLYRRASFVLPSAPRSWRIASAASPAPGSESSWIPWSPWVMPAAWRMGGIWPVRVPPLLG